MSQRRFISAEERGAIWEAHNKKCVLTTEPVSWPELQIDHIVALSGSEKLIARLQVKGIIEADFDVNGLENLIPTKNVRNRQKSDLEQVEGALIFYLGLAAAAKPKIQIELASQKRVQKSWSIMLKVLEDSERNNLSPQDYISILTHHDAGDAAVRFPLEVGGLTVRQANSAYADSLMDMPFFCSAGGEAEGVRGEGPNGDFRIFETPREFQVGVSEGYQPITSFEMNMWGSALRTTATLKALSAQQFAPHSLIRFPHITLRNTDRWSSDWMLIGAYPDREDRAEAAVKAHPTIADAVSAGIVCAEDVSEPDWIASYHWPHGFSVKLYELLRGDLDDDGDEEILVCAVSWARTGTFRATAIKKAKVDSRGLLMPFEAEV